MNRLWKFLFLFTWVVVIVVMIILAIRLSESQSQTQQQIINQYVTKGLGASAYEIAVQKGFVGSQEQWLASLHGKDGENSVSTNTVVEKKTETTTIKEVPVQGKSSYEVWLSLGNIGTEQDYLNSLKGEPGTSPDISIRYNQDLNIFQTKRSTDVFWKSVTICGGTSGKVCN